MISTERATKAIQYLAENDEEFAIIATELDSAKKDLDDNDRAYKNSVKIASLSCSGTNPEKEAKALQKGEPQHYLKQHTDLRTKYNALLEKYNKMKYKRETEELVLRLYQTVSANRRQGSV